MTARDILGYLLIIIVATSTAFSDSTCSSTDSTCQSGNDEAGTKRTPIAVHQHYEVLEIVPHDATAFTQGLTYDPTSDGLWEGTGLYGSSEVRLIEPETGRVKKKVSLKSEFFGEGISFYEEDGRRLIVQLSWQEKTGWVYEAETMELIRTFAYETSNGEGWGITYNPNSHEFYVSDGSHYIMVWDAKTLQETRRFAVHHVFPDGVSRPVQYLNELEFFPHDQTILANIWYQDVILKIDAKTGNTLQVYDFSQLYKKQKSGPNNGEDCFNGIALTDNDNELWVTGKLWPKMYRVKLLV
mmetsp:Transcript_28987/g.43794  ORF Transcript_28987/g.43794 Transcript_28987/m.43794 type:complete len:298 (-) Transcript_28987:31-924(-)